MVKNAKKGFTLIETIITLVVFSVLMSGLYLTFNNIIHTTKEGEIKQSLGYSGSKSLESIKALPQNNFKLNAIADGRQYISIDNYFEEKSDFMPLFYSKTGSSFSTIPKNNAGKIYEGVEYLDGGYNSVYYKGQNIDSGSWEDLKDEIQKQIKYVKVITATELLAKKTAESGSGIITSPDQQPVEIVEMTSIDSSKETSQEINISKDEDGRAYISNFNNYELKDNDLIINIENASEDDEENKFIIIKVSTKGNKESFESEKIYLPANVLNLYFDFTSFGENSPENTEKFTIRFNNNSSAKVYCYARLGERKLNIKAYNTYICNNATAEKGEYGKMYDFAVSIVSREEYDRISQTQDKSQKSIFKGNISKNLLID